MLIGGLLVITIGLTFTVGVITKNIDTNQQQNLFEKSDISSTQSSTISLQVNDNVCNTTACNKAGKLIANSINASVNPCDDFYQFACGNWIASHPIPADRARYGSFDALDEDLQQNVRKELLQQSKPTDAFSVKYASDFFKSCINETALEQRGVKPLLDALQLIGDSPFSNKNFKAINYSWKDAFVKFVGLIGISPVFSVSVQPDANDTKVHRVYYDAASFGLGRNQLVNTSEYPDIVNAYRNFIFNTAVLLGADNSTNTKSRVEDVINFESKLATFSTPPESRRDADVWYNKMNFTQFNSLTSNKIDWLDLTNQIYRVVNSSIQLKYSDLVIVEDIPYYKHVSTLIQTTPIETVANYFAWNLVSTFGYFTTKEYRDIEFEFDKVVTGVDKQQDMWRRCAAYLEGALAYPVSRLYVDNNFSKKDKEQAAKIVKDLKESFRELVKVSDWLDDQTKNKSLEKLDAIIENVGYPDWIMDNQQLDKYYNLEKQANPNKAFESMLYIQFKGSANEFKDINKPVNKTIEWPMPPAIVNAAYEPTQNSITIPAGILKPPFFDSQRPAYMNFGGIGLVIGHEITHGFDDEGSQFDKNGNLVNWWSDKIRKRFDEKATCFVNEYTSYYDPNAKMHLNGNNTVGENIADNGGLRESFNAYNNYVKQFGEPPKLPYVEQYSQEQLFYLSYANVWCSSIRTEALKQMIQYNPHSPAKYRVDVPLSNYIQFSSIFQCNQKSKMNPKNKCVLW